MLTPVNSKEAHLVHYGQLWEDHTHQSYKVHREHGHRVVGKVVSQKETEKKKRKNTNQLSSADLHHKNQSGSLTAQMEPL